MIPLKDNVPHRRLPWVNYALILLNFLVFYHELTLPLEAFERFIDTYAFVPARLWMEVSGVQAVRGINPLLTIFTSTFLHAGWLHILGNMLFLWIFGDNVEDALGHLAYLLSYLAFGGVAGLTQYYVDPSSTIPNLGASGAIAGVLGLYLVLYPAARVLTLVPLFIIFWLFRVPAVVFLIVWFMLQTFSGIAVLQQQAIGSGVAYWAHIGGFVAGFGLGVIFRIFGKKASDGTYQAR
ncbi:MAG: rhomboid family intramembrane serine protease [Actinomycetota bacterium]|nr:rhomboid family intramembrane serine protease [Actinomycetota bacterium]